MYVRAALIDTLEYLYIKSIRNGFARAQVPFRKLIGFHKIQTRLVRELEKKFSGKDVVIVGNRKIMKPSTSLKNQRPRSRTLTSVHDAILEDLVYPTEVRIDQAVNT